MLFRGPRKTGPEVVVFWVCLSHFLRGLTGAVEELSKPGLDTGPPPLTGGGGDTGMDGIAYKYISTSPVLHPCCGREIYTGGKKLGRLTANDVGE